MKIFSPHSALVLGAANLHCALQEPLRVLSYSELTGLSHLSYVSFKSSYSATLSSVGKLILFEKSLAKKKMLFIFCTAF